MQITVERGGELLLLAPPEVDETALRAFVHEKRFWVYTKLAAKDRLQRPMPRKEFVGGDTTPHYHAATDTAATLTMPLVALGARLVALVIAREAGAP